MSKRILIAGTHSGCGKTTITIAVMKALLNRGLKVSSFKCGPDYIDPMYHKKTLGISAYNLDAFFCTKEQIRTQIQEASEDCDIAVIEGVMGYYDGYGSEGKASTFEIANLTDTPAILIVDAKGMGQSAGAVLKGFLSYRAPSQIVGVIFNHISGSMYAQLSDMAKKAGITALGYMPYEESLCIKSRHLGLLTAEEISDLENKIERLGVLAKECLDIDKILELAEKNNFHAFAAKTSPKRNVYQNRLETNCPPPDVNLAVARDAAFCFLYEENIKLLEKYGCRISYFSPLRDEKIPDSCQGLYLPGGYPENYLKELSQNTSMLQSVYQAVKSGIPTIAECGGFLYLHELVDGIKMVGAICAHTKKQSRLVRFGYGTMTAKKDCLILKAGESIRIHEFHYYDSDENGNAFVVKKASNQTEYECAYADENLYAGFPHLYFPANEHVVANVVDAMKKRRG